MSILLSGIFEFLFVFAILPQTALASHVLALYPSICPIRQRIITVKGALQDTKPMKRYAAKAAGNLNGLRSVHEAQKTTTSVGDSCGNSEDNQQFDAGMSIDAQNRGVQREKKAPYGVLWSKCNSPSRF